MNRWSQHSSIKHLLGFKFIIFVPDCQLYTLGKLPEAALFSRLAIPSLATLCLVIPPPTDPHLAGSLVAFIGDSSHDGFLCFLIPEDVES